LKVAYFLGHPVYCVRLVLAYSVSFLLTESEFKIFSIAASISLYSQ